MTLRPAWLQRKRGRGFKSPIRVSHFGQGERKVVGPSLLAKISQQVKWREMTSGGPPAQLLASPASTVVAEILWQQVSTKL